MIGTKLAHYEITGHLGTGGMGEVYRATDSRLGRSVAIKLLAEAFARNEDRVSRFEREAHMLASLNHPHIAAIYGLEESEGRKFLVMELVSGETLAERISRGPIPVVDALQIATQICEALETAHEKGVVHRDLKPANIKVTPDGRVKVLDFGLAKAFAGDAANVDLTNSPTISMAATREGVILGTAAYMSPEQAKGQEVDQRTDIFAFGCVLYEMLTGMQTFPGEGIAEILASVLKSEPDWNPLPNDTPAAIRRLLRRCLRKDRNRRLQTVGDARIEIEESGTEPELLPVATPTAPHRRQILKWIAAGAGGAAAGALGVSYFRRPADEPDMSVADIVTLPTSDPLSFAVSPDGSKLVFVVSGGDKKEPTLWLRSLVTGDQHSLPGTEGATSPFWKPDSQSIAYFAQGKLKRIDIDVGGRVGTPQNLANMPVLLSRGGTWSPHGFILFPLDAVSALSRVPESPGGKPEPVTMLGEHHARHSFPCFLPDGRRFLFYVGGPQDIQGLYLGSMDSTTIQLVIASVSAGAYLPSGWLLFVSQNTLMAQRFDPVAGKPSGPTVEIGAPVESEVGLGAFSVAGTTGLVAYRAPAAGLRQLIWFGEDGKRLGEFGSPDESDMASPAISPNGSLVAVESRQSTRILDPTPQPFESGGSPIWSWDGRWIAYYSGFGLWVKPSKEKGEPTLIIEPPEFKSPCDWNNDNLLLYFKIDFKSGLRSLWLQPMTNDGKSAGQPRPFLNPNPACDEFNGRFSPNGSLVAYQSNESKTLEIHVVPFSGKARSLQVSTGGGIWPRWSPDGKELYYLRLDGMLMKVAIAVKGADVERGASRELWRPRILSFSVYLHSAYDVSLRGDRKGQFLIDEPIEEAVTSPITIVKNWKPQIK